MRILLTGGSSFTGLWFARALAAAGHIVVAPIRRERASYSGIRRQRVDALSNVAEIVENCEFGCQRFLDLAASSPWDALCHHAAEATDYRSPSFNANAALVSNTRELPRALLAMKEHGLNRVVLTGSVFEANEGVGSTPMCAFSPYGLSKTMTAETFRYWCHEFQVPLVKFVIPNPFGPFEEPRFCTYLIQSWKAGKVAQVKTPSYVRDNIHVDLLAVCYRNAIERYDHVYTSVNPSGYVETQGAFAMRFATAMQQRLGIDCRLDLTLQTEFPEPVVRINTDPARMAHPEWSERDAWDSLAAYYEKYV